ncbi:MAG TPA: cupin domain-containing protein [Leptolyngbyaceae cyanobacterium M33_DOE_097]|uniref:Cupin domain-containing protein n=1 Tax=Oscillatoriales cyanobacterium SpSt-418 TaxID=2282169 RepID=A0A7C3PF04_9CYAN|nr:cupin domain-containing protein [Leptolyngbyaceae cyanobacterium M33_DOE_097]
MDKDKPFNILSAYVVLGDKGDTTPVPVGDNFFQDLADKFGDFSGRRLVSHFSCDRDWDSWEMHPHGEELVYLLSGRVDFVLEQEDGQTSVALEHPGDYVIVPRGVWHTAKVHEPCSILFVTPGEATQHRACK